jgi:hypothetical protein
MAFGDMHVSIKAAVVVLGGHEIGALFRDWDAFVSL